MRKSLSTQYAILYPESGLRSGARLLQQAIDHLATEYMGANPGAEPAAIDENARVRTVGEAMEILSDAGVYTFTQAARDEAEAIEDLERAYSTHHPIGCLCGHCQTAKIADAIDPRMGRR